MGVLENQNVFITGGGSGIGLACAKAFAADGANVLIMGRSEATLEKAAMELQVVPGAGTINIFAGSVSDESDVEAAVDKAEPSSCTVICPPTVPGSH